MIKSGKLHQPLTRFLVLRAVVALVCILFYMSRVIKTGYYAKSVELFALTSNETQASNGASQVEVVASFKDHGISKEGHEDNETTVSTATLDKLSRFQDLTPLLRKAGDDDKTVIMTSVNWAWAKPGSLLDLFLESFRNGEKTDHFLKHLLIVAFDQQAFERCTTVHLYCYKLKVDTNFTGQQGFMTKGYVDLVWAKIELQQFIVEQGYNFLFTDVDIMWYRNPFEHIDRMIADITTSCDYYYGNPDDLNNLPNTGFFFVNSSDTSVKMMKYWHDARTRFPFDHEQGIFNQIKQDLVNLLKVKIKFIDTKYVGCFCSFSNDVSQIYTMHSNCCVNGLEAKLSDLRILSDNWKNYTALPKEESKRSFTWSKPGYCRI